MEFKEGDLVKKMRKSEERGNIRQGYTQHATPPPKPFSYVSITFNPAYPTLNAQDQISRQARAREEAGNVKCIVRESGCGRGVW